MKMEDFPSWNELTDEQKGQFKALIKSMSRRGTWIAIKNITGLFLGTILCVLLDVLYVQSVLFTFLVSILNGFMFLHLFKKDLEQEEIRIRSEVAKILK